MIHIGIIKQTYDLYENQGIKLFDANENALNKYKYITKKNH